ncbi:MinD-like ATPase involved in chromosome partitioning or flagellar assembly [Conyzicola nivalis]|uniref:MinD-like ATPase involved in chromosome partitioning or flagellar assembly n=1 Tax=Conyzicola nivalis TaxID=1477021 RepID=A0ABV2QQX4_9MICO
MTVRIALAVPSPHDERLAFEARRHGHDVVVTAVDADDLESALVPARPEVAIVWADERYLSYGVLAECDARGVRVVAAVSNDVERRYATGIGLYDLVDAEAGWDAIATLLPGADAPAPAPHARGTVIAVWGPAGSPGRTTLAIAIAAEIAAAGFTVALADVDTHSASVAPALGLMDEAPGFAAACRLAGADSLDRAELERIGQRHDAGDSSFWVLTGIGQPSRWPELSADRVLATIDECRRWVDYVVLDTASSLESDEEISSDMFAPRRNAATVTALREADHIVAVASADPVGLARFLRAHGDLADVAVTLEITVVANKVRASAIGLGPAAQVTQTLSRFGGIDDPVLVPWDQQAMDAAVLSARTLAEVAPKSAARLAIRRLVADRLLPVGATRRRAVAGSRLWRR